MGNYKKDRPFIIVKYVSKFIGIQNNEYEQVFSPDKIFPNISRGKAMELIDEYEMVEVFRDKDGVIWSTPDKVFLEKYKGFFKKKEIEEKKRKEMLLSNFKKKTTKIQTPLKINKNIKKK